MEPWNFMTVHKLGMSSSGFIFFRGVGLNHQPDNQYFVPYPVRIFQSFWGGSKIHWGTRRPKNLVQGVNEAMPVQWRRNSSERYGKIWDILGILEHIGDFWCSKTKHKKGLPKKSGSIWLPESPYRFFRIVAFRIFQHFSPSLECSWGSEIAGNWSVDP